MNIMDRLVRHEKLTLENKLNIIRTEILRKINTLEDYTGEIFSDTYPDLDHEFHVNAYYDKHKLGVVKMRLNQILDDFDLI